MPCRSASRVHPASPKNLPLSQPRANPGGTFFARTCCTCLAPAYTRKCTVARLRQHSSLKGTYRNRPKVPKLSLPSIAYSSRGSSGHLRFASLRRGRVHCREPAARRPLPQLAGGRGFGVSVGRGWLPLYVTTGGACLARNLPTLN